jgi:hypothetical protein
MKPIRGALYAGKGISARHVGPVECFPVEALAWRSVESSADFESTSEQLRLRLIDMVVLSREGCAFCRLCTDLEQEKTVVSRRLALICALSGERSVKQLKQCNDLAFEKHRGLRAMVLIF